MQWKSMYTLRASMKSSTRVLLQATLFLLLCSACAQIGISSPGGSGEVGQGWSLDAKCQKILEWSDRFAQEYPHISMRIPDWHYLPQIANLYRDDLFRKYFGITYEQQHAGRIQELGRGVIFQCEGLGKYQQYYDRLGPRKVFFDIGFAGFNTRLAGLVAEARVQEQWLQGAQREVRGYDLTRDNLAKLENIVMKAETATKGFWPSEHKAIVAAFGKQRVEFTGRVLEKEFAAVEVLPPTTDTLRRIKEVMLYTSTISNEPNSRLTAKLQAAIEAAVIEKSGDLGSIPLTVDGIDAGTQWFVSYKQDLGDFSDRESVAALQRDFDAYRVRHYDAVAEELLKTLDGLGVKRRHIQKYKELIGKAFPLEADRKLPVYQAFRKQASDRQKAHLAALVKNGTITSEEMRQILDEYARSVWIDSLTPSN